MATSQYLSNPFEGLRKPFGASKLLHLSKAGRSVMATKPRAFVLVMSALLLAPACSSSTGPKTTITGTYALISVNGAPIPATVVNLGKVNSGSFTINSGNAFSSTLSFTESVQGQSVTITDTCTGTFTENGNSLTFAEATSGNPDCGGNYMGSWDGATTLTIDFNASLQTVYKLIIAGHAAG